MAHPVIRKLAPLKVREARPNKRLKLAARVDYGMNLSVSAPQLKRSVRPQYRDVNHRW